VYLDILVSKRTQRRTKLIIKFACLLWSCIFWLMWPNTTPKRNQFCCYYTCTYLPRPSFFIQFQIKSNDIEYRGGFTPQLGWASAQALLLIYLQQAQPISRDSMLLLLLYLLLPRLCFSLYTNTVKYKLRFMISVKIQAK
jgi:hypothetical protein